MDGPDMRRCLKAMTFMDEHLRTPITLADLAHAASVKPRTLEQSFHVCVKKPPMVVLREKRLDRIRYELLHSGNSVNVKALMHTYGFHHGGDFAKYYTARFKEHPSVTFRRGKRSHP